MGEVDPVEPLDELTELPHIFGDAHPSKGPHRLEEGCDALLEHTRHHCEDLAAAGISGGIDREHHVDLPAHVPHHQDYWEQGRRLPALGHTEGVAGLHLVLEKCVVVLCDYANGLCVAC